MQRLSTDADGVHLGHDDLSLDDARRIAAGGCWVGPPMIRKNSRMRLLQGPMSLRRGDVSFHDQIRSGCERGCWITCFSIIQTSLILRSVVLTPRGPESGRAWLSRVAVCSEICGADDLESAMRAFVEAMGPVGAGAVGE